MYNRLYTRYQTCTHSENNVPGRPEKKNTSQRRLEECTTDYIQDIKHALTQKTMSQADQKKKTLVKEG